MKEDLRKLYIDFFKANGHVEIPSASLIPENDPSVLFNTAGMQPLVPYLMGEKHPEGKRLVDYQKCVRLTDLDEIGDTTHHTFFEMLGNWSLGDYFKEEAIDLSFRFLTEVLNIPVDKLAFTVFKGNSLVKADEESKSYWMSHGVSEQRIAYMPEENNWWGPASDEGPCGPDTEIFYYRGEKAPAVFDPNDENWVEIWNNVFMQYNKTKDGKFLPLEQKNVDTGMGYERTVAILEGKYDSYTSSVWQDLIKKIEELSHLSYEGNEKSMRILADHLRTSIFIAGDDAKIVPSNTDQGYILRRLIRRAIRHAKALNIDLNSNFEVEIADLVINKYQNYYGELKRNASQIKEVLTKEKEKFSRTLEKGLREFEKVTKDSNLKELDKDIAFRLYDTYGFPIELTVELAKEKNIKVDEEGFKEKFKEHQEKSRQGSQKKFKGGLGDHSEMSIKYHTATHLLNAALKKVLAPSVHQRGSNITQERMRFDFSWDRKMTKEELQKTEDLVNQYIQAGLEVSYMTIPKEEAVKSGAEAMFIEKYGDMVTVYKIGNVSLEICGGPHVKNTKELGHFKIVKEEASSQGVRRIKAVLE